MKAIIYSLFMFLFLLLGAGQTSYGFDIDMRLPLDSSEHTASVERANDKAVAVEQLTLTAPEISVNSEESYALSGLDLWAGNSTSSTAIADVVDLNYLSFSASIIPSLSRLDLIFPFPLFP